LIKDKTMEFLKTKEGRDFINNTIPDFVDEMARFNDLFERALDYYALETFGKIPRDREKSS
tara:strand:- start:699 stop:881 length:183 start_codon:yes stop_codon:yes gene_type:complete